MRNAFAKTLLAAAQKDKRIMLLTGDLGYSVFEEFIQKLPGQYLNMGVAEQNMAGVAAGLAMEGMRPVIYSIVPFTTMRNFEQIRNDICYQNLDVKIVGVGAGFSYGPYGHTHHGLEDVGILRSLPNMVILAPGDPVEAALAAEAMFGHAGPVYLRLGKAGEPVIHTKKPSFRIGKGIPLTEGKDVTIIATSTMLGRAAQVAEMLNSDGARVLPRAFLRIHPQGAPAADALLPASPSRTKSVPKGNISVRLISMPTIKPIDKKIIIESAKKTRAMVTIEEHSVIGGLGSAVSEVLAESGIAIPFERIAVPDRFTKGIGLQEYMRRTNKLDVRSIVQTVKKLIPKAK